MDNVLLQTDPTGRGYLSAFARLGLRGPRRNDALPDIRRVKAFVENLVDAFERLPLVGIRPFRTVRDGWIRQRYSSHIRPRASYMPARQTR